MQCTYDFAFADRDFLCARRKTNVLFFTKGTEVNPLQDENCTTETWVYDLRTNMPSFGKRTPFTESHLKGFEVVYGADPKGFSPRTEGEWSLTEESQEQTLENSRWRKFSREWIKEQKRRFFRIFHG